VLHLNARTQTITRTVPPPGVPCYSASGRRLRSYSLEAIGRCLALEPPNVVVKRNKRTGRITSAQFVPQALNSAALGGTTETLSKSAHLGQHYSYSETVDDRGHRAWRFAQFLMPRDMAIDDPEALELDLQKVFRAVALSCLVTITV
jgi:hypothetical protein